MDVYKSGLDAYKSKKYREALQSFKNTPRDHPKYANSQVAYAKLKRMMSGDTSMPKRSREEKEKALKERYEMSKERRKKALSHISESAKDSGKS
jgi:hypothetical protein